MVEAGEAAPGAPGDGDLDLGVCARDQLVQDRSVAVAQGCPGAGGQHGRHPPPLAGQQRWRHERVHPRIQAEKTSAGGTFVHRGRREPEIAELVKPEHGVLAGRQVADPSL